MLIFNHNHRMFYFCKYKRGFDLLEDEISHLLFKDYEVFELSIPYSQGEDFKYYINIVM